MSIIMSEKLFSEDKIKEFQLDKLSIEDLNEIVKSIPSKIEETLLLKKEEKDFNMYDLLNLLKYIYVARNIREYGVLSGDYFDYFKDANYLLRILFNTNLIHRSKTTRCFINLEIIDLTEEGEIISKILISSYLKVLDSQEIFDKFEQFLLYYIYDNKINRMEERFRYYQSDSSISIFEMTSYDKKLNLFSECQSIFMRSFLIYLLI